MCGIVPSLKEGLELPDTWRAASVLVAQEVEGRRRRQFVEAVVQVLGGEQ